jgi:hypothetical protein
MKEHWSVVSSRAREVLRQSGGEIEDERDWMHVTWRSRELAGRVIATITIDVSLELEEVEIETAYWVSPATLPQYVEDFRRFTDAVAAIEVMRKANE